jgi:hypothetical protein
MQLTRTGISGISVCSFVGPKYAKTRYTCICDFKNFSRTYSSGPLKRIRGGRVGEKGMEVREVERR